MNIVETPTDLKSEQKEYILDEQKLPLIRPNRPVIRHSILGNRQSNHDPNILVEAVTFTSLGKIQPFLIILTSNAALTIDFHSHLTTSEVVGYLAGSWDVNTHTLVITHAFPCKSRLGDFENAPAVENEILTRMKQSQLTLLGWYHSHPKDPATPSLRDIDTQLDYELKMRGNTETSYIPCVGLICSPYCTLNNSLESQLVCFWVAPPPETRIYEYGKPMMMVYSLQNDDHIGFDTLLELKKCVDFYKEEKDYLPFAENSNYLDKLKASLSTKFPRNLIENSSDLWNFLSNLLQSKEADLENKMVELANTPPAPRSQTPEPPKLIIPELPPPSITPPKISPQPEVKKRRGRRPVRETPKAHNFGNYFMSDFASAMFANPLMAGAFDPATLSLFNMNSLALGSMFLPPFASYKGDSGLMKPPPPPLSSFYPFATSSGRGKRSASNSPSSSARASPSSGRELKVPKVDAGRNFGGSSSPSSSPALSQ